MPHSRCNAVRSAQNMSRGTHPKRNDDEKRCLSDSYESYHHNDSRELCFKRAEVLNHADKGGEREVSRARPLTEGTIDPQQSFCT